MSATRILFGWRVLDIRTVLPSSASAVLVVVLALGNVVVDTSPVIAGVLDSTGIASHFAVLDGTGNGTGDSGGGAHGCALEVILLVMTFPHTSSLRLE